MFRIVTVLILAVAATASADEFQIGGTSGLTSSYILTGCPGCIAGSAGGFSETNYETVLFSGAVNGASTPTPFAGYNTFAPTPEKSILQDSTAGVTFSMIADGLSSSVSNNAWIASSAANPVAANSSNVPTITIPIGIFGVTDVWTMLNSQLGLAYTNRDATIYFDFGSTANATTNLTTVKVKLLNTPASGSAPEPTQIRNAVDCASPSCNQYANTPGDLVTRGSATSPYVPDGVSIVTHTIYTSPYTNASGPYAGTTGNIVLDDQGFFFGDTFLESYLVDIRVAETAITAGTSSLALSAITVETVPEPSTIFMMLTGLGAMVFAGFRFFYPAQ